MISVPPADDKPAASRRHSVAVLGVPGTPAGGGPALTRAQKRFNQLVDKLRVQRRELQHWQAYQRFYQQQLGDHHQPLMTRLRAQRIAMAGLLDTALDGRELGKRERDKAQYLLNQLIASLLEDGDDPVLEQLHDKYSAASLGELRGDRMAALRSAARATLDIDIDAYAGGESPAEFEHWLEEQIRATHAAADEAPKRKSAQSGKRKTQREQVAEGGTRAVREAYRKLVSELHPDRETDPDEQTRKTELMQRVNQAYKAGDLLGLLELQLSLEQIDAAALAGLADERLRHYVHVLEEQGRQLRDELQELIEPFAVVLGETSMRKVTTDAVQRRLDQDIRTLKTTLRRVEMDVICFQDIRQLKHSLGQFHIDPLDDEDLNMPDDFDPSARAPAMRRGGARRTSSRERPVPRRR
jgi:hypothetical protein